MSPSEIAFLAFGLVLGTAIGAALVQGSGSRLAPRREVRLTITPNAIPARRAHTLAVPYDTPHPGIIPGSPDDGVFAAPGAAGRDTRSAPAPTEPDESFITRTRVSSPPVTVPASAVAVPITMATADAGLDGWPVMASLRPAVLTRSRLERPGRDDPFTTAVPPRPPVGEGRQAVVAGALATSTPRATTEHSAPPGQPGGAADAAAIVEQAAPDTGPCSGQRRRAPPVPRDSLAPGAPRVSGGSHRHRVQGGRARVCRSRGAASFALQRP